MKKWRPDSWSQQARRMSDKVAYNVNQGYWCIEEAHQFFRNSYRAPIIVERAAKRFGRMIRAGKIHESPEAIADYNMD